MDLNIIHRKKRLKKKESMMKHQKRNQSRMRSAKEIPPYKKNEWENHSQKKFPISHIFHLP